MMIFAACLMVMMMPFGQASAATVLKPGSSNGEVWDLQYRLNLLGYYTQGSDGIYGPGVTRAVRAFQYQYGLPVDGVVGAQTWSVLKKFSVNQYEMDMLAKLVYAEARGESYKGQVAVAAVVMNRLQSPKFPNTVSGVIFEPWAFTAIYDGQYGMTPNKTAYLAARDAARGWDPTYGAIYYFNPNTATSGWMWSRPQTVKIGEHIFAR
ncbi:spore cortex-lytic enzyme [Brevibacillus dissolubilis]|uniref:spore cortex-lytic enzyme n=1 Tax=Brevibacillus dissolubilis TaxID=1844116 RepID=UPI0021006036|nr:spore cortex-lytic enzyme [Brevibacillus dissolubilis]